MKVICFDEWQFNNSNPTGSIINNSEEMDLNKFKSLSISNVNNVKSPLRRLRNRTIYPNIEIIAVSTKDQKSSEELQR